MESLAEDVVAGAIIAATVSRAAIAWVFATTARAFAAMSTFATIKAALAWTFAAAWFRWLR